MASSLLFSVGDVARALGIQDDSDDWKKRSPGAALHSWCRDLLIADYFTRLPFLFAHLHLPALVRASSAPDASFEALLLMHFVSDLGSFGRFMRARRAAAETAWRGWAEGTLCRVLVHLNSFKESIGPALLDGIIIDVEPFGPVKDAATGRVIPCNHTHSSGTCYLYITLSVVGQGRDSNCSFSFDTHLLRQIHTAAGSCHALTQQQILGKSFGEGDIPRMRRVLAVDSSAKGVSDVLGIVLLPEYYTRHIRGCHFVCQQSLNPYSQVLDCENRLPVTIPHPPMTMCGRCQSVTYCSPGQPAAGLYRSH